MGCVPCASSSMRNNCVVVVVATGANATLVCRFISICMAAVAAAVIVSVVSGLLILPSVVMCVCSVV